MGDQVAKPCLRAHPGSFQRRGYHLDFAVPRQTRLPARRHLRRRLDPVEGISSTVFVLEIEIPGPTFGPAGAFAERVSGSFVAPAARGGSPGVPQYALRAGRYVGAEENSEASRRSRDRLGEDSCVRTRKEWRSFSHHRSRATPGSAGRRARRSRLIACEWFSRPAAGAMTEGMSSRSSMVGSLTRPK